MNKQTNPRSPNESGLTLVEVVFSMVIMGTVLGALAQGLALGIRMNTDSKTRLQALNVCKRVTERLKSQVQYSQNIYDNANENATFNGTFYADADGNFVKSDATTSLFRITTQVQDWKNTAGASLSTTDSNGVNRVLVKYLDVTVVMLGGTVSSTSVNSKTTAARQTEMRVEMVRPAS